MFGPTSDRYGLLHRGTRVRKMHSSYRSTFRTVGDIPLCMVGSDGFTLLTDDYRRRDPSRRVRVDTAHDDLGDPIDDDRDTPPLAGDAADWSDAGTLFAGDLRLRVMGWHDVTDDFPEAAGPWDYHHHGTALASVVAGNGLVDDRYLARRRLRRRGGPRRAGGTHARGGPLAGGDHAADHHGDEHPVAPGEPEHALLPAEEPALTNTRSCSAAAWRTAAWMASVLSLAPVGSAPWSVTSKASPVASGSGCSPLWYPA